MRRILALAILGTILYIWLVFLLSEWRAGHNERQIERIERLENILEEARQKECRHNPTAEIC